MQKSELIKKLATESGLTQDKAKEVVNTLIDIMGNAFTEHEDVVLPGFGVFKVVDKKASKAFNVHTRETITVPAHAAVKFVPNAKLKERITCQNNLEF